MKLGTTVEATHENGYTGRLYGRQSMSIYDKDGNEVLHTGFRNINTKEELLDRLADMPKFLEQISCVFADEEEEGEDV